MYETTPDSGSDSPRHVATDRDMSRQNYTLSLHAVMHEFDQAQLPRTIRTLQRYCKNGRLDCLEDETPTGMAYLVDPRSVERAIAELKLIYSERHDATGRDMSQTMPMDFSAENAHDMTRPDATRRDVSSPEKPVAVAATSSDMSRHVAEPVPPSQPVVAAGYVEQLTKRIEEKDVVIGILRTELAQRNDEIVRRNERERETNILIRGLQNLVLQLQPGRNRGTVLDDNPPETEREVGSM